MRRRRLPWVLLAFAVLLAAGAVYAWQAHTAYTQLRAAQTTVSELRANIVEGDTAAAEADAEQLVVEASSAREAVHGPHWSALRVLPLVGPNVAAVQEVTVAADRLAGAVPELVVAARTLDPEKLAPVDGRIDVTPLRDAAPRLAAAHRTVGEARERLAGIDPDPLLDPLRRPLEELDTMVADLHATTGLAARAAELLPSMLGADGPRDYLLLAQNTAEPRALGGIPGAVILVRADEGRVELVEHRTGGSFGNRGRPVLRLSRAERALYGTQLARYMQNVTSTPDFPRAARLARRMWADETGKSVDGVAAIDPFALQLLLGATGPVRVPGGRLTGDNAAQVLLNQVYLDHPDPAAQDAFFAAAAARVFGEVMSGRGDLRAVGEALATATQQGRVLLWSGHRAEQALLAGTPLAGELRGQDEGAPVVGVYLHDRSGAKIAYYQRMSVQAGEVECRPDGSRRIRLAVTLRSEVPKDVAALPDYLTGGGVVVQEGRIRTDVLVYAPTGGRIEDVALDGAPTSVRAQVHDGLPVVAKTLLIAPGKEATVEYNLVSHGLTGPLRLRTTPAPVEGQFSTTISHCP